MKIFHTADLHYSAKNLEEADRCFGFAVTEAIRQKVDVAIIAGDSTDHALEAHSAAMMALAKRIRQLADHCPVFMLQGTFSHEPQGLIRLFAMLGAKHPIAIADRIGMIALENGRWHPYIHREGRPDLVITAVPTVNRAECLKVSQLTHNEELAQELGLKLSDFAPFNRELRDLGVPTVLVSHGTVQGSVNEHGLVLNDTDHEYTTGTLFSAGTDAVMLGHIHQFQSWKQTVPGGRHQLIAYSGSVGRYHYGEQDEKCALIWTVQPGMACFERMVTPSCRMIDISFEGRPDMDELTRLASQCDGACVRIRYQVDEEYADTVDRDALKAVLSGACEVKIEGTIVPVQRQRAAGISKLNTQEKFAKWCELTETPIDGLLEKIAMLQNHSTDDVVDLVIRKS